MLRIGQHPINSDVAPIRVLKNVQRLDFSHRSLESKFFITKGMGMSCIAVVFTIGYLLLPCKVTAETHEDEQSTSHQPSQQGHSVVPASEQLHGEENADEHGQHSSHSSHGELHLIDVLTDTEFIGSVINFVGLLVILVWLGRKPLGNFLNSRRQAIQDGLADAARMKEAAEAKYQEYSQRLEKLDEELKKLTDSIQLAAKNEQERIIKEADQRSKRLAEETQRLIDQQMKQLYEDIIHEVVDTSVATAESVLREKLDEHDQQRLARNYLGELVKTSKREENA